MKDEIVQKQNFCSRFAFGSDVLHAFVGCDVTTTVYFNPNYDGAEKITVEMGFGDKLTPPQVSRDGYYVEGWYLEKECTTPVNDFGLVWTGSEYFAKWNPNPVSLSATYEGYCLREALLLRTT